MNVNMGQKDDEKRRWVSSGLSMYNSRCPAGGKFTLVKMILNKPEDTVVPAARAGSMRRGVTAAIAMSATRSVFEGLNPCLRRSTTTFRSFGTLDH